MVQSALSLKQTVKGQILIEALFVIAFILAFLIFLQGFHLTAQQKIQKERLSKQRVKRFAPWVKPLTRDEE